MEDNKLYKKNGRKYVPIGVFYNRDWLGDGIWYVRSNGSHITNGGYIQDMFKVCDKPLFDNFKEYCDLEDVADTVMNTEEFRNFLDKLEKENKGWSINDIVHITLAILKKKSQENNK